MDLTEEEKGLINLALTCYIDDGERQGKKLPFTHPFNVKLAQFQRLAVKLNPGSLCGDWKLADGTILKKP